MYVFSDVNRQLSQNEKVGLARAAANGARAMRGGCLVGLHLSFLAPTVDAILDAETLGEKLQAI